MIDLAHDDCGPVPNGFGKAEVLISLDRRDIENAMPEAAECDGGMPNVGLVCASSWLADVAAAPCRTLLRIQHYFEDLPQCQRVSGE